MQTFPLLPRRLISGFLLVLLLALAFSIVKPFLASIAWALILCYVTWPLYLKLRTATGNRQNLAALLMTTLLACSLVLPMAWLVLLLEGELVNMYLSLQKQLASGPLQLPEHIRALPVIGPELEKLVARFASSPDALKAEIARYSGDWSNVVTKLIGGAGKNLAKLGFALLTAFFVYRDGERLLAQVTLAIRRLVGERERDYMQAAGATTRAVVYGIVLTALGQGLLAGIGYWIFGAPSPVLLAALTTIIALIPFGTPFAWGGVAVWMVINGDAWGGIGLALWGVLLVSWVDNIIRPLVISAATRIPFILVMFGVLGGLAAFGMVGLFIGPVVLAVLLAVWREWLEEHTAAQKSADAEDSRPASPDV
ncbi:MAG: AI-2E family transporter [Pseudomonadota bacterium]